MHKVRIGVLMGGRSIEREVSFNSGRTICDHLDTQMYDVVPIFQKSDGSLYILPWHFLHRGKIADFEHRLTKEAQRIVWDTLKQYVDYAYIAMHGRFAEDGIMQATLELLGIPYLGSSIYTSALCMDKIKLHTLLAAEGINIPKHIVVDSYDSDIDEATIHKRLQTADVQLPVVTKPHKEGSSIGITIARTFKQLIAAIQTAQTAHPDKKQAVLIEEQLKGMEFSCITLRNPEDNSCIPLPPTEIVHEEGSDFFDYDQKYMPGRALKFTPPRCSAEIQHDIQAVCKKISEKFSIETISRIDGIVVDKKVYIFDVNTFSGMAPSSFVFREAAEIGMSHTDLINHLITTDLYRYNLIKQTNKSMNKNKKTDKIRVGVLLGGPSHEREISLESGRNVVYKLSPHAYQTTPIFVDPRNQLFCIDQAQLVRNSTQEIAATVQKEQQIQWHDLKQKFDFIFIGLHGAPGENGCVQGMLEMLDIPYNGSSVFASALAMDKHQTASFLKTHGFDVPNHQKINVAQWQKNKNKVANTLCKKMKFPLIVKPVDDGCSVMVQKVDNTQQLMNAIETIISDKKELLVEEFIGGMELTVGVIGNQKPFALIPSQAIAADGILSIEEKFLPGAGENQTPAPLPEQTLNLVRRTMEQVYTAVGCKGYARIDCFYQAAQQSPTGKERVVVLEINSLPGLTPATCIFHQAAELGIKPMEFVDLIVQYGMAEHANKPEPKVQISKATHVRSSDRRSLRSP